MRQAHCGSALNLCLFARYEGVVPRDAGGGRTPLVQSIHKSENTPIAGRLKGDGVVALLCGFDVQLEQFVFAGGAKKPFAVVKEVGVGGSGVAD